MIQFISRYFKTFISSWPIYLIVIIAIALRSTGIFHGIGFHPDERGIVMGAMRLSWSDLNPNVFHYGSLIYYLLWIFGQALEYLFDYHASYDNLFIVGRSIAVICGAACVGVVYALSQQVYRNKTISYLASSFLALNILHIQLSKFYATDIVLTLTSTLTLLWIIKILECEKKLNYLMVGIFIGISFALKISALLLFIPLLFVLIRKSFQLKTGEARVNKFISVFLYLVFSTSFVFIISVVSAFLFAPYQFIDFEKFVADVARQISMINGVWRPPYVIQYDNTTPYLYHLKQIFFYTTGVPVASLTILGVIASLLRMLKKINYREGVLLFFIFVVFFLIAGKQVKFPRYLLPIYPLLSIFAAQFVWQIARGFQYKNRSLIRGLISTLILLWLGITSISFINIYTVEHSYKSASRWISKNIPKGSVILGTHWDDRVPVHLPNFYPGNYYGNHGDKQNLNLYNFPDNISKIETIADKLIFGDYIIFPTRRLYGSIPKAQKDYPLTTAFIKSLFSKKLGYKIEKQIKVYPKLGFFTFNDDLADESLLVYDHPRVIIFKKNVQLSKEEIVRQILNHQHIFHGPTLNSLLSDPLGDYSPNLSDQLLCIIKILLVVQFFAFLTIPITSFICSNLPDNGYGITKGLSLILLSYFVWLFCVLSQISYSVETIVAFLFIFIASSFLVAKFTGFSWEEYYRKNKKNILVNEVAYLAIFIFFLLIRAFHPEIYWGEKPMDFTFFNYFIRAESIPPDDPWAVGHKMSYYYFGYIIFSIIHKLTNIPPDIGYNIIMAMLPALVASALYTILFWLTNKRFYSFFGSIIVILSSNLAVFYFFFFKDAHQNFNLFWKSSRVFTSPAFSEYPIWSFLFADLHAHVIAMPFTFVFLALTTRLLVNERIGFSFISYIIVLSLTLGSLIIINTWDFLSYSYFLSLLVLLATFYSSQGKVISAKFIDFLKAGLKLIVILYAAYIVALPFTINSISSNNINFGRVANVEQIESWQYILHYGQFFIPVCFMIIISLFNFYERKAYILNGAKYFIFIILIAIAIAIFDIGLFKNLPILITFIALLILFKAFMVVNRAHVSGKYIFITASMLAAITLILICELYYLQDRMNSIFKFYNSIWILLSLSTFGLFYYLRKDSTSKAVIYSTKLLLFFFLGICLFGSYINVRIILNHSRVPYVSRPTLLGSNYLKAFNTEDYKIIRWLNKNVKGTPTLIEATGPSYGNFTRIAMHTGLPTILGWHFHVIQRGLSRRDVLERSRDIKLFYNSPDINAAYQIALKYNIDIIVVGEIERKTYGGIGLKKFSNNPNIFTKLAQYGDSVIFAIKRTSEGI